MATFTLRIDERGRDVLLNCVELVKKATQDQVVSGDYSDDTLTQHEELLQLHRGILYVRPDPEPTAQEPSDAALEPELDTPSY